MPNCFQLIGKVTKTATSFAEIDDAICKELNVPMSETKYYLGWYDFIGLSLALGSSFDKIRQSLRPKEHDTPDDLHWAEQMLKIVDYLDEHYVSNAWAEIGRR